MKLAVKVSMEVRPYLESAVEILEPFWGTGLDIYIATSTNRNVYKVTSRKGCCCRVTPPTTGDGPCLRNIDCHASWKEADIHQVATEVIIVPRRPDKAG